MKILRTTLLHRKALSTLGVWGSGVFLTLMVSLSSAQAVTLKASQVKTLGIKTAPAKTVSGYESLSYVGYALVPLNRMQLVSAPTSGRIHKIHHFHGWVEKGEILLELESTDLLNREKDYLTTLLDEETKKQEYDRAARLNKTGVVSDKQKQQAWASLNKVRQRKTQQKQDLELMGMKADTLKKLESTKRIQPPMLDILSPISGDVTNLVVKVGQRLSADTEMMHIAPLAPLAVSVAVPIDVAQQLKTGQDVRLLGFDQTGEVEFVSRFTDEMSQTQEVHVEYPNQDNRLNPGQSVQVRFVAKAEEGKPLYQIDKQALGELNGETVVFALHNNELKALPIEVKTSEGKTLVFQLRSDTESDATWLTKLVVASTSAAKAVLLNAQEGDEE